MRFQVAQLVKSSALIVERRPPDIIPTEYHTIACNDKKLEDNGLSNPLSVIRGKTGSIVSLSESHFS